MEFLNLSLKRKVNPQQKDIEQRRNIFMKKQG